MASASPSPGPAASSARPRAITPLERQRQQLEKLLKDPTKSVYIPPPPKEKVIRPPREMMKNVQGSSAGAGSGEFHVYKASRRREYERLKMMDDITQKEAAIFEFEDRKRKWEEDAEAKTAKNRAKRQKKKAKSKVKTDGAQQSDAVTREASTASGDVSLRKKRLVNGKEMIFKKPGEEDEDTEEEEEENQRPTDEGGLDSSFTPTINAVSIDDKTRITIHEDD